MTPLPASRSPVTGSAMVTTSQPQAAQAGLAALQRGGNAMDAALAAAITLTVVEPVSNGIGGDLFALVCQPGAAEPVLALNASGRSPRAWTPQRFAGRATMPMTGWDAVTVPGAPAGWRRLSDRAGQLPFAALFDDAIRLADDGFAVTPVVAGKWAREGQRLAAVPGFADHFLPGGRSPAAGERFRTPYLGDTLRDIAASGSESFYRGALSKTLVRAARAAGAAIDADDLAAAWADNGWVQPLHLDYRGHHVYQLPPNGQGITTLIALGILQHFDSALLGSGSANAQHLAIEALKLAFVDTYRGLADPQAMTEAAADWLQPDRLGELARRIDPDRASDFGPAIPPWGGTVYVAAADTDGMMVSLIQSNFVGCGSGVVVPGTGISLHNRGAGFSLEPGHPNQVGSGKRPLHTIIPALVMRQGQPWGVLGVTGGPIQPQGQVQLLLQMIDGGQDPQAAVDRARWKIEHKTAGLQLDLEPGYPAPVAAALRSKLHASGPPGITGGDFGGAFAIVRTASGLDPSRQWSGAADPRRDGLVSTTAAGLQR